MNGAVPMDPKQSDPESHYVRPVDVVRDSSLSRADKIETLNRWEQALQARLTSSGEGMTPHQGASGADGDAARVSEIALALRMLDAVDPGNDSANTSIVGVASHAPQRKT